MKIVISQPMYFPWIGIFEQMALADSFIHYDDVRFPQGRSFISRVKITDSSKSMWLTVPTLKNGRQNINQVKVDYKQRWQNKHLNSLAHCYAKSPFKDEMMSLVENVLSYKDPNLARLNIRALEAVADYFELGTSTLCSSSWASQSSSSQRLIELVKSCKGTEYITGHGAKNYLDHAKFEENEITVNYMDYKNLTYPQLGKNFISHMSILDLIANMGRKGKQYISSQTVDWRTFING